MIDMNRDVDLVAEARERLVNRVVNNLVDEMVQARLASRPDIHGGPLPNRLEAFENLDLVGAVVVDRSVPIRARRCRSIGSEDLVGLIDMLLVGMFHAYP